jgi:hypothetical protein
MIKLESTLRKMDFNGSGSVSNSLRNSITRDFMYADAWAMAALTCSDRPKANDFSIVHEGKEKLTSCFQIRSHQHRYNQVNNFREIRRKFQRT